MGGGGRKTLAKAGFVIAAFLQWIPTLDSHRVRGKEAAPTHARFTAGSLFEEKMDLFIYFRPVDTFSGISQRRQFRLRQGMKWEWNNRSEYM